MALFLSILKIIGIVLLVILGVILLLLLLVLFVPIRYAVDAAIAETDLEKDKDKLKDNISGTARFSWLLHFISGGISYPDEMEFKVKVLCFTLFPPKKKKSDAQNEEIEELDDFEMETEAESGFDEKPEEGSEELKEPLQKEESEIDESINSETQDAQSDNEDYELEEDEFDDEDKGFLSFLRKIFDTIVKIIKVPQDVFSKIQYTTSRIYDKINMVKNTLSNDIFKRAFEVTKKQLIKVLKMIIPRKFKANFLVGLEDPTVTADILAGYGVLYPLFVNKVFLVPEFDRQVIKGDIHIKGRITVFTLVYAAAILYFNKDVKKTVRRFKKIIDS